MRFDPESRIHSYSFKRDRGEHAALMLALGKRLTTSARQTKPALRLAASIVVGLVFGVVVEIYRFHVLPYAYGPEPTTPLPLMIVLYLPLLVALSLGIYVLIRREQARRLRALADHLSMEEFVDVDVFRNGIASSTGGHSIQTDWTAIDEILVQDGLIVAQSEGHANYLPRRAFASKAAFDEAASTIRKLWRDARRAQRDRALIDLEKDNAPG
jgi:hypothetical protein